MNNINLTNDEDLNGLTQLEFETNNYFINEKLWKENYSAKFIRRY